MPSSGTKPPRILAESMAGISILSAGMIFPVGKLMPRWSVDKVDRTVPKDLSDWCPEHIPLLVTEPGAGLVSEFAPDDGLKYPVLIELNPEFLETATAQVFLSRIQARPGSKGSRTPALKLYHGLIPVAAVSSVLFRNQSELERFSSVMMGNFDVSKASYRLVVDPDAFSSGTLDPEKLKVELCLASERSKFPATQGNRADALAGAAVLLFAVAWQNKHVAIKRILDLLQSLRFDLTDCTDVVGLVAGALLEAGKNEHRTRGTDPQDVYLQAVTRAADLSLNSYVPEELYKGLLEDFPEYRKEFELFLSIDEDSRRIAQVPTDLSPDLKSLLNFTLSPESTRQFFQKDHESEIECELRQAILTGAFLGLSRLPLEITGSDSQVTQRIVGAVARRANDLAGSPRLLRAGAPFRSRVVEDGGIRTEAILAGEHVIAERHLIVPFEFSDSDNSLTDIELASWCRQVGFTTVVETVYEIAGMDLVVSPGRNGSILVTIPGQLPENGTVRVNRERLKSLIDDGNLETRTSFLRQFRKPDSSPPEDSSSLQTEMPLS